MLRITEQAATLIRDLLDDTDLPHGAGLRIAQRDDHRALAMRLTASPGREDVVHHEHDAAVFLGPEAAARVHGQTLDASASSAGAAFYLRD